MSNYRPKPASDAIRRSMSSNRPRDTQLELDFRSALHRAGLRFRKNVRPISGLRCEPDVVFPSALLAVFIDGCWWHGCPKHGMLPMAHREWWANNLQKTKARDVANTEALESEGWKVLRIWEHEPIPLAVQEVQRELARLRERPGGGATQHGGSASHKAPGGSE